MELRTVEVLKTFAVVELLVQTYVCLKHCCWMVLWTLRLLEWELAVVLWMVEGPLLVWADLVLSATISLFGEVFPVLKKHPYDIFVQPLYDLMLLVIVSAYHVYCTIVRNMLLSFAMLEAVVLLVEENVDSSFPRWLMVNGSPQTDEPIPCWSSRMRETLERILVKSTLRLRRRAKVYIRTRLQALCTFFMPLNTSP